MDNGLAGTIGREMGDELTQALERIRHCLGQLSDEELWWRPAEGMNSIGNLLLHLAGNVRQWIISGLGGAPDDRDRAAEFAARTALPKADLLKLLEDTVAAAQQVMTRLSAADWQKQRHVQYFDVTGLAAALHSVAHFRGHTQEIIHMTRTLRGDAYQFAWKPPTTCSN
jgi:hypothetical protein